MLLIPAIDLKNGKCVRLQQGNMEKSTIFSDEPESMATHWLSQGARRLHLVDLNGAFLGKPKNKTAIKSIILAVKNFSIENNTEQIPIQLGGGIRDLDTIEKYLDEGIKYVIIGTAIVKNPGFLKEACSAFPGQIVVSLDARNGKVATDGWSKLSGHDVIEFAKKIENSGCSAIIFTDIGRDGMKKGLNINATVNLAKNINIPVIASGGLRDISEIKLLCQFQDKGIVGVICGRSIYDGILDLKLAQNVSNQLTDE